MSNQSSWRAHANKVIAQVAKEAMAENPAITEAELRKKTSAVYPFGPRRYHPYKIWLSAVKEYFAQPVTQVERPRPVETFEDLPMFGGGG